MQFFDCLGDDAEYQAEIASEWSALDSDGLEAPFNEVTHVYEHGVIYRDVPLRLTPWLIGLRWGR